LVSVNKILTFSCARAEKGAEGGQISNLVFGVFTAEDGYEICVFCIDHFVRGNVVFLPQLENFDLAHLTV